MIENEVEEKYICFDGMAGVQHIESIRKYLDYMEEHLFNIRRAFVELSDACESMPWVGDDYWWHTVRIEVEKHDLSKFSDEEFLPYVRAFFPIDGEEKTPLGAAWEHHKEHNHHHWETVENTTDIIHMVIDWTAMGYKFGDTAEEYYKRNADRIILSQDHIEFMQKLFAALKQYRKGRA